MNSNAKTTVFLSGLSVFLLLLGWLIARYEGVFFAIVLVTLILIQAYWYTDRQILYLYRARKITELASLKIVDVVRTLSEKIQLPIPTIYLVESTVPNVFSVGRNPASASIVMTTSLMNALNHDELTAVIAHELIRIQEKDTWASSLGAALGSAVIKMASLSAWIGSQKSPTSPTNRNFAMVLLAPFAAIVVRLMNSREHGFQIDHKAAALCEHKEWLISALKKLEENKSVFTTVEIYPATAPLFMIDPLKTDDKINALFSVHPSVTERIQSLETA